MDNIERNYDRFLMRLKIIGLYQILCNIIGFALLNVIVTFSDDSHPVPLTELSLTIICYTYGIVCGIMLFWKPAPGIRLTLINQLIQLFNFLVAAYLYPYLSGIILFIFLAGLPIYYIIIVVRMYRTFMRK